MAPESAHSANGNTKHNDSVGSPTKILPHKIASQNGDHTVNSEDPPLPGEAPPPLPNEAPPVEDDGWEALWDDGAQTFYFHNRFTMKTQWTNPRVPDANQQPAPPGVNENDRGHFHAPDAAPPASSAPDSNAKPEYTGYNPAIHGDYDPTAPYAQQSSTELEAREALAPGSVDPEDPYAATGAFNRFTGKWQAAHINPDNHNDESKSRRQMSAFFDVDAAANSHNGRSLKAERAGKKLSKQELKAFKEKRKERKEEKRRAWLRD